MVCMGVLYSLFFFTICLYSSFIFAHFSLFFILFAYFFKKKFWPFFLYSLVFLPFLSCTLCTLFPVMPLLYEMHSISVFVTKTDASVNKFSWNLSSISTNVLILYKKGVFNESYLDRTQVCLS